MSNVTSIVRTQKAAFPATLLLGTVIEPGEIGERIKQAREKNGWTQLKFAMEANVSPSSVARWEAGKLPPVRELVRISEVLGIEPDQLVEQEPTDEEGITALRLEVSEVRRMLEELMQRPQSS